MGGFLTLVKNFVNYLGNIVNKVLSWFEGLIRKKVEDSVEDFIKERKEKITKADDPKKMGKTMAMMKMSIEIKNVAISECKTMTEKDQETIKNDFQIAISLKI